MKNAMVTLKMSTEEIKKVAANLELSKSARIRVLFDGGLEIKEIAEALNIRYNFVFNVLQNYININDIAVEKTVRNSKRDEIVELIKTGASLADISKMTKTNYNYIWKINKELKTDATIEVAVVTETPIVTPNKTTKKSTKNGPVVTYNLNDIAMAK